MKHININFKSKRHQNYKKNWNIYINEPDFKRTSGKYMKIPLGKEICHLFRDVGFRENIQTNIQDNPDANKAIDRIIYENRLDSLLSELATTVAAKGEGILKNSLDNGRQRISIVQPEYYFPKLDKLDQRLVVSETIAIPSIEGDEKFLYTETYEKRDSTYWCITKKHYFNNDEMGEEIKSETKEINTQLTESPLTHFIYSRDNGDFFGTSIFEGLYDLLEEYNHRVSKMSAIFDKHSDPNILGDPSLLNVDGQLMTSGGVFLPYEEKDMKPEYMHFDSKLESHFQYIDEIILKAFHYVSILNPSLYGLTKETNSTSAKAIKMKAFRTSGKIENSLKHWEYALKKVLFLAQQIENISGKYSYTPELPEVKLNPSMPYDDFELAQAEQLKIAAKITATKSSIARLNPHYTSEQVEAEFLEIINEENIREQMSFLKESDDLDFQNRSIDELQKVISNG